MNMKNRPSWLVVAGMALLMGGLPLAVAQGDSEQKPAALYNRLGGLAPLAVVVSDFIDALVSDAILNANPAIDAARKRVPAPYLKYQVTAMVCQATGGPCVYRGRGMKAAHAHLNITEKEWDHMVTLFTAVLTQHQVPTQEAQELVALVGSTKADIVAAQTGH